MPESLTGLTLAPWAPLAVLVSLLLIAIRAVWFYSARRRAQRRAAQEIARLSAQHAIDPQRPARAVAGRQRSVH